MEQGPHTRYAGSVPLDPQPPGTKLFYAKQIEGEEAENSFA
jgi:hypothetical protein